MLFVSTELVQAFANHENLSVCKQMNGRVELSIFNAQREDANSTYSAIYWYDGSVNSVISH